jgi:hypothetical protein
LVLGLLAFVVMFFSMLGLAMSGPGFVLAEPASWTAAVAGPRRMIAGAVAALCLAGLVLAATRIALGAAATIDRGRVQLLATWPTTRSLVTPILVGRAVLGVVPVGFAWAVLRAPLGGDDRPTVLAWAAGLAAGLAVAGLWLPLSVGLMAYLYRRLPAA